MAPKNKPKGKEKPAAAGDKQPTAQELALQHTVYYYASTSEIKDDVVQLASCWKSGHGPLTKQEAGILLWYHCHRGEDGQAEVVAAGVINTCMASLDSQDAPIAEQSTAAGILLELCAAGVPHKETIVKAKAGANVCCQVLHSCMSQPDNAPRHVPALLASLASSPVSLAVLLKTLQGNTPWPLYCCMLEKSRKDHSTAISVADFVRYLVTGRADIATEAGSNGLLQALLTCAARHKSAAAVASAAACLQALCGAAPDNRLKLGKLPGAIQALVDLLGPPPATITAWEQQEYKHILAPPQQQASRLSVNINPPGSSELQPPLPTKAWSRTISAQQVLSSNTTGSTRTLGKAGGSNIKTSMTPRRAGTGTQLDEIGPGAVRAPKASTTGSLKPVKSVQLPDIGAGEGESSSTSMPPEMRAPDQSLNSKQSVARHAGSLTGTEGMGGTIRCHRTRDPRRSQGNGMIAELVPELPLPSQPLLCKNSTSLKWDGPVPDAARSAVAGVLSELVLLPELCKAVHDRLGASRLAVLLQAAMRPKAEGEFLAAADNADCYRVAAGGCLPALVQLTADSKHARLRQSAKAVLSQMCVVAEVQQQLKQAEVPEELLVEVPMKLVDEEIKHLQIEFPNAQLVRLDDVTARARK